MIKRIFLRSDLESEKSDMPMTLQPTKSGTKNSWTQDGNDACKNIIKKIFCLTILFLIGTY